MFLIGFVPGYVISWIFNQINFLRADEEDERAGLDPSKVPAQAYPEGISPSSSPAE